MNRIVYKYMKYFLIILIPILLIWLNTSKLKKKKEQTITILDKDNFEDILVHNNNHNYLSKYKNILKCNKINLPQWTESSLKNRSTSLKFDYSEPASNHTHNDRVLRAVIVYFPIDKQKHFEYEFKWFYRSWIEMLKYEPVQWRTDLIVFIQNDNEYFKNSNFFLNELKCSFENIRKSKFSKPMCTLIDYLPLNKRKLKRYDNEIFKIEEGDKKLLKFLYLLEKIDIFSNNETNLLPFYT